MFTSKRKYPPEQQWKLSTTAAAVVERILKKEGMSQSSSSSSWCSTTARNYRCIAKCLLFLSSSVAHIQFLSWFYSIQFSRDGGMLIFSGNKGKYLDWKCLKFFLKERKKNCNLENSKRKLNLMKSEGMRKFKLKNLWLLVDGWWWCAWRQHADDVY